MKKIIISILILLLVLFAFNCGENSPYEEQESSGVISISVQPTVVTADQISFNISLNTHSGSLASVDLKRQVRLKIGDAVLEPSEVPQLSGHHSGGTIVFRIERSFNDFELIVSNVPDKLEREFKWSRK